MLSSKNVALNFFGHCSTVVTIYIEVKRTIVKYSLISCAKITLSQKVFVSKLSFKQNNGPLIFAVTVNTPPTVIIH